MAALGARFAASLGDQRDRLTELLVREDWTGVRELAHGLAGRSGMFGYAALGEVARSVDEAQGGDIAERANALLVALGEAAQER